MDIKMKLDKTVQNSPALFRRYMKEIPTIDLSKCEYDRKRRVLTLASEFIGMPSEFYVRSHHTGKTVRFTVVNEYDVLFDQDGWDGEQCVYRPVGDIPKVDHLVIYN
jgi:hypothetical protein